ncbi:MAG: hypothetical protein WD969_01405 [Paracoccaceae bacterium]
MSRAALAEAALGAAAAEARIAEIEEGRLANPPRRMMAAIATVLGIDPQEAEHASASPESFGVPAPVHDHTARWLAAHGVSAEAERRAAARGRIAEYIACRQRIAGFPRHRPAIRALIQSALAAMERAGFDEVDSLLAQTEASAWRSPLRIEIRKERGEVALLGCEVERAAGHFEAAAAFLDRSAPEGAAELRNAAAASLRRHGRFFGAEGHVAAARLIRRNLEFWRMERRPEKWAMSQHNLGAALHDLAITRKDETTPPLLTEAVGAYRAALRVYTQDKHPRRWCSTQGNLATALGNLAWRRRGKAAAALSAEAARAYRASLARRSRTGEPAAWATGQAQLSLALGAAAALNPDAAARAAMLIEAAEAGEAALGVFRPDTTPDHWAAARNNLGNTRRAQAAAVRSPGDSAALLQKAVAAFREALDALNGGANGGGEAETARRAAIRTNLAATLTDLCARVDRVSAARLSAEAVAAARAALSARPPEAGAGPWAASLSALIEARRAEALATDGEMAALAAGEATTLCRQALGRWPEELGPARWAEFQIALGRALEAEAACSGPERAAKRLVEARAAYAVALSRLDPRAAPALAAIAEAGRRRAGALRAA